MIFKNIQEDIRAFQERDPAAKGPLAIIFTYPGFHAVVWHRIAHWFWTHDLFFIARLASNFARWVTLIEIHPGAEIGKRLVIDHGGGVVIGETAVIGDDVTIYHQVTLGGVAPSVDSDSQRGQKRHPSVGDGVIIGCGAAILGPITVGKEARVGANAVVTRDIPAGVTAVGNPAQVVLPKDKKRAKAFQAYGTPTDGQDPVMQTIENLRSQLNVLIDRVAELEQEKSAGIEVLKDDDAGADARPKAAAGDK
ncbi:MAG: serine O-acetyltransferase [Rhodospirillales bacterium]